MFKALNGPYSGAYTVTMLPAYSRSGLQLQADAQEIRRAPWGKGPSSSPVWLIKQRRIGSLRALELERSPRVSLCE